MTGANALQPGDAVPHFAVHGLDGRLLHYREIWQRRNLVLVTAPGARPDDDYVRELTARASAFDAHESSCVITRDRVDGVPAVGLVVADRWGEIVHIATVPELSALPPPGQLLEWLEAIEHRCPECEGEAK